MLNLFMMCCLSCLIISYSEIALKNNNFMLFQVLDGKCRIKWTVFIVVVQCCNRLLHNTRQSVVSVITAYQRDMRQKEF